MKLLLLSFVHTTFPCLEISRSSLRRSDKSLSVQRDLSLPAQMLIQLLLPFGLHATQMLHQLMFLSAVPVHVLVKLPQVFRTHRMQVRMHVPQMPVLRARIMLPDLSQLMQRRVQSVVFRQVVFQLTRVIRLFSVRAGAALHDPSPVPLNPFRAGGRRDVTVEVSHLETVWSGRQSCRSSKSESVQEGSSSCSAPYNQ